jgi:hypothetical protein
MSRANCSTPIAAKHDQSSDVINESEKILFIEYFGKQLRWLEQAGDEARRYADASAIMITVVSSIAAPNAAQTSHGVLRRILNPISATTSQAVAMTSPSKTAPSNFSMTVI